MPADARAARSGTKRRHNPSSKTTANAATARKEAAPVTASYLTFPSRADVKITGTATDWRVAGDSGNEKIHSFCPICGTPVYLTFAAMPDLIAVHAASLDDPSRFSPTVVTYSIRGLAWDTMDTALQTFETMPPG